MDISFLKKKELGLPLYAWAGIIAVVLFLLYRHFKSKSGSTSNTASSTGTAADTGSANGTAAGSSDAGSGGSPTGSGLSSPDFNANTEPDYTAGSYSGNGLNDPYGSVPVIYLPSTSPASPPEPAAKATPQSVTGRVASAVGESVRVATLGGGIGQVERPTKSSGSEMLGRNPAPEKKVGGESKTVSAPKPEAPPHPAPKAVAYHPPAIKPADIQKFRKATR